MSNRTVNWKRIGITFGIAALLIGAYFIGNFVKGVPPYVVLKVLVGILLEAAVVFLTFVLYYLVKAIPEMFSMVFSFFFPKKNKDGE